MKLSQPILAALAALSTAVGASAQLAVSSTLPTLNANNVATTAGIVVNFDRPVNTSTFTPSEFYAFARWMGRVPGSLAFSNSDQTVTFTPAVPFAAGDVITLFMSHDLKAADGTFLRQAGYTLMFTVVAAPSPGTFCHKTTFSDRTTPNGTTRIYGGLACDLNLDGAPDLTLVNEVSGDLRTYLNRNDGSGLFQPMLAPTSIPFESSPNEPADFNGDGFVDIATSSNLTNQVTIAFGNGAGGWGSPTIINTGGYPRGIAVLDCDGDGDMDMAVSIRDADTIALYTNNGSGVFGAPANVSSAGDGPYGLAAADMNNDGVLDLVIGHVFSQTAVVLRGNGNGTFTLASSRSIGGTNWVIACGDVNNDGRMDVAAANAGSSNGSILRGNGDGTLQAAAVMPNGGHTTGTDLVDVDGDGDLDWIISAYGASKWYLYRNNGAGVFLLMRDFEAPGNPACSVSADFDRDGDIDLILLDETTDLCLVMINSPNACYANCDCSGAAPALTANDFQCFLNKYASQDPTANCDGVGGINANDFTCFLNEYANGCI
jgi:hypothetical protein